MRVGLTGGTGFVGAALVGQLLDAGCEVIALARDPSKLPTHDGLTPVEGDLENAEALREIARGSDAVIHLAGLTHATSKHDYRRANVVGAARAASAAREEAARFVHISSISAREPQLSPYAASKRDSESAVSDALGESAPVILRLPAIYGPGDEAFLPYFKTVKSGIAMAPRVSPPARASVLYVEDAAGAIAAAAFALVVGDMEPGLYDVDGDAPDGRDWAETGAELANVLQVKARTFRAPKALLAGAQFFMGLGDAFSNRRPSQRPGQLNELFHPDWVARDNLLSAATGWRPRVSLEEGFAKTVFWYQDKHLL